VKGITPPPAIIFPGDPLSAEVKRFPVARDLEIDYKCTSELDGTGSAQLEGEGRRGVAVGGAGAHTWYAWTGDVHRKLQTKAYRDVNQGEKTNSAHLLKTMIKGYT